MPKLNIQEQKTLILQNVIVIELRDIRIETLERTLLEVEARLNCLGVSVEGDFVLKSCGSYLDDLGGFMVNQDVYVQARNYLDFAHEFKVLDSLCVDQCLYLRYIGDADNLHFATNKIDLYLFEHDLVDSDQLYTILIKDSKENLIIDYYKPLLPR